MPRRLLCLGRVTVRQRARSFRKERCKLRHSPPLPASRAKGKTSRMHPSRIAGWVHTDHNLRPYQRALWDFCNLHSTHVHDQECAREIPNRRPCSPTVLNSKARHPHRVRKLLNSWKCSTTQWVQLQVSTSSSGRRQRHSTNEHLVHEFRTDAKLVFCENSYLLCMDASTKFALSGGGRQQPHNRQA